MKFQIISFLKKVRWLFPFLRVKLILIVMRFKGAKIGHRVYIENIPIGPLKNLSVGDYSFIGERVTFGFHDKIIIGKNVVINNNVMLLSGSHDINEVNWPLVKRQIFIDDYAWIAMGAIILKGARIGRGAVVGAGAVVRGDVAPYSVVVGNPAVKYSSRKKLDFTYKPSMGSSAFHVWYGE